MASKKAIWISGAIVVSIICVALVVNKIVYKSYDPDEEASMKFNSQKWISEKNKKEENDRHYMITDLLANELKTGMDSAAVKKLLGEPERDFGFSYNLGFYRSGFDPTFLIIEFDKTGRLIKTSIETI